MQCKQYQQIHATSACVTEILKYVQIAFSQLCNIVLNASP